MLDSATCGAGWRLTGARDLIGEKTVLEIRAELKEKFSGLTDKELEAMGI
jgi:uncharacterized UPF0160 family protein